MNNALLLPKNVITIDKILDKQLGAVVIAVLFIQLTTVNLRYPTGYFRVSLTRNAEYSSSVWNRGPGPRGTGGTQYWAALYVYILNDYVERPFLKPLQKFCVVL